VGCIRQVAIEDELTHHYDHFIRQILNQVLNSERLVEIHTLQALLIEDADTNGCRDKANRWTTNAARDQFTELWSIITITKSNQVIIALLDGAPLKVKLSKLLHLVERVVLLQLL
jgi:hypothetical protein